jgi:hypothetical protein
MGLDMYVCTTAIAPTCGVDFKPCDPREFHYWRKHPNLHEWMEQLYRAKGGSADEFNGVNVVLTSDDLDRLEAVLKCRLLPDTSGCFFGESDGTELEGDLQFVATARAAIADGLTVFYSSWW